MPPSDAPATASAAAADTCCGAGWRRRRSLPQPRGRSARRAKLSSSPPAAAEEAAARLSGVRPLPPLLLCAAWLRKGQRRPPCTVRFEEHALPDRGSLTLTEGARPAPEEGHRRAAFAWTGSILAGVSLVTLLLVWLNRRWDGFWEAALKTAFETVDLDSSGTIDGKELYAGVLLLYLKLKSFVKVKPPSREMVLELMEASDVDHSGALDYSEFEAVMQPLSQQLLVRALLQLVISTTCPFLASYLYRMGRVCRRKYRQQFEELADRCVEALNRRVIGRAMLRLRDLFHDLFKPLGLFVQKRCRRLPSSFPVVMLAALLMRTLPGVLYLVDRGILVNCKPAAVYAPSVWHF